MSKMTSLDRLKEVTTVVADTGEFEGNIPKRLFIFIKISPLVN